MEFRENPMFGRKVFFVNPPMGFDVAVIKKLRESEFEVYEIKNIKYIKSVLRKYENALCFINIDGLLSVNEWYNFVKSFKIDDTLKSIFIGVMSGFASTGERGKFLINLSLPGGFTNLSQPPEKLVEHFKGILQINGAKGCRQYVRLNCAERDDINGYMALGNNLFSFKVLDISVVGFACSYNKKEMHVFPKNSIHKDISLTIGRKSFVSPVVAFDTQLKNDQGFTVMLFTKEFPSSDRAIIQNYIFKVLDEQFEQTYKLAMPDYTDYTVDIDIPNDTPEYSVPPEKPIPKVGETEGEKDADADVGSLDDVEDMEEI